MTISEEVKERQVTSNEIEFAIFCIENLGTHLNRSAKEIYTLLTTGDNLLDNYIIYGYDSLHTQGKEYIMEDITDIMRRKGIKV